MSACSWYNSQLILSAAAVQPNIGARLAEVPSLVVSTCAQMQLQQALQRIALCSLTECVCVDLFAAVQNDGGC